MPKIPTDMIEDFIAFEEGEINEKETSRIIKDKFINKDKKKKIKDVDPNNDE